MDEQMHRMEARLRWLTRRGHLTLFPLRGPGPEPFEKWIRDVDAMMKEDRERAERLREVTRTRR